MVIASPQINNNLQKINNQLIQANPCAHLAIIMDGNGRWAKNRNLPRFIGHKYGAQAVKRVVSLVQNYQIDTLTLYAFSSENWKRPKKEVHYLMKLLSKTIDKEFTQLVNEGIKLSFIGKLEDLPQPIINQIELIVDQSKNNTKFHLIIALNYGGRQEIVCATQKIGQALLDGKISLSELTEDKFAQYLALSDVKPVDLLIRTSGEMRLSNFLLWQLAYSEFYFTNTLWPDFDEADLKLALDDFYKRQRRFGGI